MTSLDPQQNQLTQLMTSISSRVEQIESRLEELSAQLEQSGGAASSEPPLHPNGYPGRNAGHETFVGTNGIFNDFAAEVGRVFTTVNTTYNKWTERVVVKGTSLSDYLALHAFEFQSDFSPPNDPDEADSERDDYIASQSSSMSTVFGYYYLAVPTTEANTPGGWSTKMYQVKVLHGTSWDGQGLLFREHSGNVFRDFWLLDSGYDANLTGDTIQLVPITSGGAHYYTNRKTFIESEYSNYTGGYFIKPSYTFSVD